MESKLYTQIYIAISNRESEDEKEKLSQELQNIEETLPEMIKPTSYKMFFRFLKEEKLFDSFCKMYKTETF